MKDLIKKGIISVLMITIIGFIIPVSAFAADISDNTIINIRLKLEEINNTYSHGKLSLDLSKLNQDYLDFFEKLSDEELTQYLQSIKAEQERLSKNIKTTVTSSVTSIKPCPNTYEKTSKSGDKITYYSYTTSCSVGSYIPSIGICSIHIDYECKTKHVDKGSYINKYFVSGKVLTSYQTGLSIGTWTHVRGTFTPKGYNTYAEVVATGTITYGIEGTPFVFTIDPQSFLSIESPR